jgi:hypothetical protein
MAKITPNQDFLHGKDRFKKGKEYEVDDGAAYYFAMNGWLEGSDVKGLPEDVEVTLSVDNVRHGQKGGNVGG